MLYRSTCLLAILLIASGCGRPPLYIRESGPGITVDLQTLGEYQTTITRIQLRASDQIVWEVASNGSRQIGTFTLHVGENPVRPSSILGVADGDFHLVQPAGAVTFRLIPETTYILRVWGEGPRYTERSFTLHSPNS
jgi:hypothetical protein